MLRLGGGVIPVQASASSACKGESLADTVRCLDRYCDVVVLRHPDEGSAREAADVARVPVLNAGDGVGEHPTQALLDAHTIRRELGWGGLKTGGEAEAKPWRVTFVGDLKHGRTVHSLAKLLATHFHVSLRCVSPISLRLPDAVCDAVHTTGTPLVDTTDLVGTLAETDVLYVTRIQKERFATAAMRRCRARTASTRACCRRCQPRASGCTHYHVWTSYTPTSTPTRVRPTSGRWSTGCTCEWRCWRGWRGRLGRGTTA